MLCAVWAFNGSANERFRPEVAGRSISYILVVRSEPISGYCHCWFFADDRDNYGSVSVGYDLKLTETDPFLLLPATGKESALNASAQPMTWH